MSGGVCLAHRTGCLALVQTQDAGGENVCNFVEMSGMGGVVGSGVSQWPPPLPMCHEESKRCAAFLLPLLPIPSRSCRTVEPRILFRRFA